MSFSSFATLEEAWGGLGERQPPAHVSKRPPPLFDPSPSDVDYSKSGAPIMDDIVNLYTPADAVPLAHAALAVPGLNFNVALPVPAPVLLPVPIPVIAPVPHRRKGDDYDEEEGDSRGGEQRRRAIRQMRGGDETSHAIELAAYVLSGIVLIFLFESFITLGGHLRPGMSYY